MAGGVWELKGIDLTGVHSVQEIGDRIRQGAATKPGRNIVTMRPAVGVKPILPTSAVPPGAELDQIMPDRPLMVLQARQKAYLNSAALKPNRDRQEYKRRIRRAASEGREWRPQGFSPTHGPSGLLVARRRVEQKNSPARG